jgi:hypothetical protein
LAGDGIPKFACKELVQAVDDCTSVGIEVWLVFSPQGGGRDEIVLKDERFFQDRQQPPIMG